VSVVLRLNGIEPPARGCELRTFFALALLALIGLDACSSDHLTKPVQQSTATRVAVAPDLATDVDPLAEVSKLIAQKNWPQALATLRAIIDAETFSGLPSDVQYRALTTAGRVASYQGSPKLGCDYLDRAIAMPQADSGDWLERLRVAGKLDNEPDAVRALTVLMQRWPDRGKALDSDFIIAILRAAKELPAGAEQSLLQALYDAHWKVTWDMEPSHAWRDLVLLLLEKDELTEANDVAGHITDVDVLIGMRADRRFDHVVAANPAQFDIESAAEREFRAFQAEAERAPQSLLVRSWVIESLLRRQHYVAALAASDSILADIRSTNYPEKLFVDYEEERSGFLNLRSDALQRVGRWDEAVAQLTAASLMLQKYGGNVDQLTNLGDLYCTLGRPKDALLTLGSMTARTSPYGGMQVEAVRADAFHQLGDFKQMERSLQYLRIHRAEAPGTYEDTLIAVNQLDRAAHELVAELTNTAERQDALFSIQTFAPTPGTPRTTELDARRRAVIARPEVQEVIRKVGRVESYPIEIG
jgi:tetratricopeptide (TPR) repeat protein